MDDRLLELLEQWEEATSNGKQPNLATLAGGDAQLAAQLQLHAAALKKIAWLDCAKSPAHELRLPSVQSLSSSLLTPEDLTLETLQANLAAAEIVPPAKLIELLKSRRIKTAHQLAGLLLEKDLITRFQLRSIAHGKTRGLKLGRYVILDKIGEGGMGQVFKARHSKMGRIVALKVLPRAAMSKSQGIERFNQEMKVAAKLRHENIVTAFDADDAEGLHFFVMEYVEGRDLSSVVRKDGPLSVAKAVDCLMQAAQGLEYAHEVGLVHRDIKPANLLLDNHGIVKILDMGIARIQTGANQAGLTQNGAVMGTVDFMAPEQAIDAKTVTVAADLYSLGCTFYYLLTGRPPFAGETLMVKLLGHREQPPPPLTVRSDVPPELEAIYQKCMAMLPGDRYPSATELIADLEKLRSHLSETPPPRALSKLETASDTSPTSFLETQPYLPAANSSLQLSIDPRRKKNKRPLSGRGASFYGGAIVVALLFCGALYYGAGLVLKFSTPPGTLVVEIEPDALAADVGNQELTLIHETTKKRTPIQLVGTEQIAQLLPGKYKFGFKTSEGLKTDVNELTILSGAESRIRVSWESNEKPRVAYALDFDGVDDYVELPFGYQGDTPLTIEIVMPMPVDPLPGGTYLGTTEVSGVGLDIVKQGDNGKLRAVVAVRSKQLNQYLKIETDELPPPGTTTNITAVFNSQEYRLYIDGKLRSQRSLAESDRLLNALNFVLGASVSNDLNSPLRFDYPYKGKIQQLRVSKTERYTADFTPQYQFNRDDQTFALYRFQEGEGTLLKDSSGNNLHGVIYGNPPWVPLPQDSTSISRPSSPSPNTTDGDWIDLLAMIQLPENAIQGNWRRRGKSLLSGVNGFDRIYVPYAVKGNYKLALEFTRVGGEDMLSVRLPTTRGCFDFLVGGYGNKLAGIQKIDLIALNQIPLPSDAVNNHFKLANGKRYRLEIGVKIAANGEIEIDGVLDGRHLAGWQGNDNRLSGHPVNSLPEVRMLGLITFSSKYEIHKLEIQLPDGAEGRQLSNADWGHHFYPVADEPIPGLAKRCKIWNGRFYLFGEGPMPLPFAQEVAQLHQARLVTISSPEEEAFLVANMPNKAFWTAAWRHADDFDWRDDRNRPLKYVGNWLPGQPDLSKNREIFAVVSAPGAFPDDPAFAGWSQSAASPTTIYPVYEWGEEPGETSANIDRKAPE
ncbi:protein kinase domain-containing protein [Blastopirellula marina]|uniref:non-specific serine/threonine protein kinase n=1 Tax=Blastopirellula marina DSM 3645 TaxID=314230 RepID=A3ZX70_9BACT|nr:protein kinase [Blastopirellula marina]EAQ78951.1 serine/threonine protein kinase [Blastopirellula marina DSM 3645]